MNRRIAIGLVIGGSIGFLAIAALYLISRVGSDNPPEEISRAFFLETYVRDFSSAWELVSSSDQSFRSRREYLAENPSTTKLQAELLQRLAAWGQYETVAVASTDPMRAVVSAHVRFPHTAQPEIVNLLEAAAAPDADRAGLLAQLDELNNSNQIQFLEGDISYVLVSERNRWRIAQHWGQSVTIRLRSAVSPDLAWDFFPITSEITALPGELVTANYFARNNSEDSITAKAIHEVGPPDAATYFQTIQCFCFTEQTLEPGEEREMVLLFRIDLLVPPEVAEIENLYTFYSLDTFPPES